MSRVTAALALGVIVLCVALVGPVLIDSANSDVSTIVEIYESNSKDVDQNLRVSVDTVEPNDNATVTVESLDTLNSSTQTLNETETGSFTIDGQTVNVTVRQAVNATNGEYATLEVIYPPNFAWNTGASLILDNLGIIIAVVAFIMIGGLLTVVIDI